MFLSDKDILRRINGYSQGYGPNGIYEIKHKPDLKIEPFKQENIQNNSYLLTSAETVDIEHLEHVNVWTEEKVTLPNNLIGLLTARSSISRRGLFFATSIGVDAGFSGNLVIEFFNMSPKPFRLSAGDKIVHILFAQTSSPCTPYSGVYANQHKADNILKNT